MILCKYSYLVFQLSCIVSVSGNTFAPPLALAGADKGGCMGLAGTWLHTVAQWYISSLLLTIAKSYVYKDIINLHIHLQAMIFGFLLFDSYS